MDSALNNSLDLNITHDLILALNSTGYDDYDYFYGASFDPMSLLPAAYRTATDILNRYITVVLWVMSLFGNSLIICVLLRRKNRHFSTSVYLTGLAVVDLMLNTVNTLLTHFKYIGSIPEPSSHTSCYYRNVVPFAVSFIAVWFLVIISIERVIGVWLPHKVKRICTVNVAIFVLVSTSVTFLALAFLHERLYTFENYRAPECIIKHEYEKFYTYYLTWILIATAFLVPYFIIFVSSIIIGWTLVNRTIRKHSGQKSKQRSVNFVLLNINIVFIVTNTPYIVHYIVASNQHRMDIIGIIYFLFWDNALRILRETNSVLNVFVYFLTGSRFRRDLKRLLLCRDWIKPKTEKRISDQARIRKVDLPMFNTDKGATGNASNDACEHSVLKRRDSEFEL